MTLDELIGQAQALRAQHGGAIPVALADSHSQWRHDVLELRVERCKPGATGHLPAGYPPGPQHKPVVVLAG